ncbi:MAG: hypothetical protein K1X83_15070 [Oligoflexia bacterium]|nr:hypothetical protein [Oligoflexia bacterium]
MTAQQKFNDLLMLVKTQRRYQIALGFLAVVFIYLYISGPGTPRKPVNNARRNRAEEIERKTKTTANEENANDIMVAFQSSVKDMRAKLDENVKADAERDKKLESYNERTAEIFKKILDRMSDQEAQRGISDTAGGVGADGPAPVDVADLEPGADSGAGADSLEQFGSLNAPEAPPPPPAEPEKVAFIGAGDSVTVKLLAAVNAPTDGTPYPVLFKLDGDVQGPDGSSLPLGEARLIAAAEGSLTDSRVLFRLVKLNIRLPDGRRKVMDVDGWIVGEDGIRGMQGIPIDPIGKGIAAGGMVGALGAVGNAFAQTESTTEQTANGDFREIVTGDVGKFAAGKAAAGMANSWGKIVSDRVKQLVPHIQVYSGRTGTAVFAQSVAIKGLFDNSGDESDVFSPVD